AIDLRPHAEQGAVAAGGNLDLAVHCTGVIGRLQVLAAVFDPFYGVANLHGRKRNQKILRVKLPTATKPATYIRLNEVDLVLWHIEHRGKDSTIEMWHLGGTPDAQLPAAGVVTRHDAARLQRIASVSVHGQGGFAGVFGVLPGRLNITD